MAFTSDSVQVRPITCVGPRNSHGAPIVRQYPVGTNQTLIKGDILILSSGLVQKAADNADLDTAAVVGIAANDKTTGGTVSEQDIVSVYDAAANFFEANLVNSETVDSDLTDRSDFITGHPLAFANVAPAPTAGQWVILDTPTASQDKALIVALAGTQVQFDLKDPVNTGLAGSGAGVVSEGGGTFTNVKVGDMIPRAGAA